MFYIVIDPTLIYHPYWYSQNGIIGHQSEIIWLKLIIRKRIIVYKDNEKNVKN
jgi:uncharacterized protein YcfL